MKDRLAVHLPINENDRKVKIVTTKPIVFLAGPIRNALPWRDDAIKLLIEKELDVFIASPARTIDDGLRQYVEKDKPEYEVFERQRAWEQYYLYEAAKNGCVFFYLPKEAEIKEVADKVYAHITMLELGEWIERHKNNKNINLVIATDGNFPEWSTVKYELEKEEVTNIYLSMQDGIDAVAHLISKQN
ncbi:MAG: nucleoside 2-deoxyribosyltransferase domain-containing protein [Parcubacteria group bacterium]